MVEEKLTLEEVQEIFGDEMPMEAVHILFGPQPVDKTTGEVRQELIDLAIRIRNTSPKFQGGR